MLKTRTGGFPIGIRRGWSDWQKDLGGLISWVQSADLSVIDLGADVAAVETVTKAGLKVGSVDLAGWQDLSSEDASLRKESLAKNRELIEACSKLGAKNFFAVLLPKDPSKPRSENLDLLSVGLSELAKVLEDNDSKLVIEGWPGPGALGCTPESLRAVFGKVPSKAIGLNFDPSHLIRMGIDSAKFLKEFATRVHHVHGKDTEVYTDKIYDFGTEQPATVAKGHGFGSNTWRYTIPGHGVAPWPTLFATLVEVGYKGAVSIELEDENFNGSEAGEKAGFSGGAAYLATC